MPDLSIETATICPQNYASFEVAGSKGNTYRVSFDDYGRTCTCPAFKFSAEADYDKTCKHVKAVEAHGCLYHVQGADAGPNDLADVGITLLGVHGSHVSEGCPGCGEPMLAIRIAV